MPAKAKLTTPSMWAVIADENGGVLDDRAAALACLWRMDGHLEIGNEARGE
jgi:hypothetical protein